MHPAYQYLPEVQGTVPVTEFASLLPTEGNPYPTQWVEHFLTLGPFVLETDGAFETEYLYERDKTLSCDYLAPDGGEARIVPALGRKVRNRYYGPEELAWIEGYRKWNALHFSREGEDCDDALFATPQRNCVFYAATYVRCETEQDAILSYENSGCLVYLNGVLVDNQPYGRVKSLVTLGHQVAVHFHQGLNLLLFKLRTGYIADAIDLSMSYMGIHPIAVRSGSLGVTWPLPTGAYRTQNAQAQQVQYIFAGAFENSPGGTLRFQAGAAGDALEIGALRAGQCTTLRVGVAPQADGAASCAQLSLETPDGAAASRAVEVWAAPWDNFGGTEHLFSDFHFDTTYHQEQRTYALGAFSITKNMLEQLRKDERFRVILSEIDYLHPYLSLYPQDRALLRQAFANRLAEADCFYNQPNELTSAPEALVRNLVYGQRYHKDYLGQKELVYSPGDVFGHPNQMSQICQKGECLACQWGKVIVGLDNIFWHMSPDGTSLLHTKGLSMRDAMRLRLNHCGDSSHPKGTYQPYPADDGMPWLENSATHAHYSLFSEMLQGLQEDVRRQEAQQAPSRVQTHSRDLTQHHSGVLLTRSDFKQANRLAENLLITAEKLATIAALHGANYPERTLDKAWRQLLCAQHHDSITGTNNEISFVDLMLEYRETVCLAENLIHGALRKLAGAIHVESERALLVYNPHPWPRCEPVFFPLPENGEAAVLEEDGSCLPVAIAGHSASGQRLGCFVPHVPALGYKAYRLAEQAALRPEEDDGCEIENAFFRLKVDPALGGGIASLWDKQLGREWIDCGEDGPANRVAALREVPDRMETQHEFYTTGQKLFSSESRANVRRRRCALYEELEVVARLGTLCVLRQRIVLWRNVRRVDFSTVLEDYQGRDDLFAVTFPVNVRGGQVIYDDRFAPHITGKSVHKLSFQTHQYLNYSHCRVAPANQWLELGPTVSVSLGEGGASINLGMTAIVRREGAALAAADALLQALTRKAVPVTLFPEGEQHGGWQVIHFQEDLDNTNSRFVLSVATEEESSYAAALRARLSPEQQTAFERRMREDGVAVLYAVDADNALEKPIDVLLVRARDEQALRGWAEDVARQLEKSAAFAIPGAFLADPCPAADVCGMALLNNGNIACSVEGENLLCMMLFHTADFYGNRGRATGGEQLIPEQKTFHASYALYPHAGDYRAANVYRRAMEFNDPLLAHEFHPAAQGSLPTQRSYLACPENFVLTCMKAGGYDMAGMQKPRSRLAERGIVLRGFETNGSPCALSFSLGFAAERVNSVNLLEHGETPLPLCNGTFSAAANGYSIETYAIAPILPSPCLEGDLIHEAEPVQPVYLRSWEQDRGSMPMGYLGLAGFIDRKVEKLPGGKLRLLVHLSNNRVDASASGTLRLATTEGLRVEPSQFAYQLAPDETCSWPVTVAAVDASQAQGILRLFYEDDGQTFTDALEIGQFAPELTLRDRETAIVATVENTTPFPLQGELQLAAPIETWNSAINPHSLLQMEWGPVAVDLAPGERQEYAFAIQQPSGNTMVSFWAIGKLMVNDHIVFAHIARKGPLHNFWTHTFRNVIQADNGSLRKFYHLNDLPAFDAKNNEGE